MVQNLDNPVDSKEYHSTSPDVKIIEVQQVCSPINSHYASESNSSVSSMDNNSNVASNESNGNSGSSNNSDQSSNDDESSDYPRKRMRMDCSE